MSVTSWTALLLQVVAVLLLRHRLGRTWLRRPVTLLVLTSVVYQGVSPVLLSFPSIGYWDIYRLGVQHSYVDDANLIMSAGIMAFTVAYLLTKPGHVMAVPEPGDARYAARILDWRLLSFACLPLALLTYEGRGYNGTALTAPGAAVAPELASTFFVILVALAAFSLVLRKGSRWFLPVLAGQSLLLAAAGERTPVLTDAIVVIVLLCHAGMRPSARQLRAAAGLTLAAILAITGVRAVQGRSIYYQDSGLGARVAALGSGLAATGSTSPQGTPGLLAQLALRTDGTDFAGAILQARHLGDPRLSASGVPESLLLAVPSALWPSKLAHGLNPALTEIDDFGLQKVNFLPGLPGLYAGFLWWPWLIAFLSLCGLLAGWGERALLRQWSPARLMMLAGAVIAALDFERGLPGMLVDLRTAVVLAMIVKAASAALARRVPGTGHPMLIRSNV
jgi:hypothetical protein